MRERTMEYFVSMSTKAPEGTPKEDVDDVRSREAAHSRELADHRHLEGLRRLPALRWALDLWRALNAAELETIVKSLPRDSSMTTEITHSHRARASRW
jgi:muconolactone D-isomerase